MSASAELKAIARRVEEMLNDAFNMPPYHAIHPVAGRIGRWNVLDEMAGAVHALRQAADYLERLHPEAGK